MTAHTPGPPPGRRAGLAGVPSLSWVIYLQLQLNNPVRHGLFDATAPIGEPFVENSPQVIFQVLSSGAQLFSQNS